LDIVNNKQPSRGYLYSNIHIRVSQSCHMPRNFFNKQFLKNFFPRACARKTLLIKFFFSHSLQKKGEKKTFFIFCRERETFLINKVFYVTFLFFIRKGRHKDRGGIYCTIRKSLVALSSLSLILKTRENRCNTYWTWTKNIFREAKEEEEVSFYQHSHECEYSTCMCA
jgi:hypothetical protein